MPAFPLALLLLVSSCDSGTVLLKEADDTGEAGDVPGDDASRLANLEERMDQVEADLAECQNEVAAVAEQLADQAEQLADQAEQLADQAEQLADLEAAVAGLGGDGDGADDFDATSQSTYTSGTSSSWSSVTSRSLSLDTDDEAVVVAFCSFTLGTASGASYRVTIANEAGTYSDDAEVVGDSPYAGLSYGGESVTVWGFWEVPSAGTYEINCEGKNSAAYDITFAAWTP